MCESYTIPIQKLVELYPLFDQHGNVELMDGVSTTTIRHCIDNNIVELRPASAVCVRKLDYNHSGRIAYFVLNQDLTPIQLDVGIPSMGFVPPLVTDGHHRLAAAMVKQDQTIVAEYSGCVDTFESMFGTPS